MLKLDLRVIAVESFPVLAEASAMEAMVGSSNLPMCTCVSCTDGFPDCVTQTA
jgi:hypothetical protein